MSSRISIIREQNIKQNFCALTKKNTDIFRNAPVTGILQYSKAIRTQITKKHNSPYPCLRHTRRPWKFKRTWASLHIWQSTSLFVHFPQISLRILRCSAIWSSARLTLIPRRSRTGTVWFYTSTSNKRAARTKLYTKKLTRDLKLMYSRLTLVRISIKL